MQNSVGSVLIRIRHASVRRKFVFAVTSCGGNDLEKQVHSLLPVEVLKKEGDKKNKSSS
jgi:hypothetical protein